MLVSKGGGEQGEATAAPSIFKIPFTATEPCKPTQVTVVTYFRFNQFNWVCYKHHTFLHITDNVNVILINISENLPGNFGRAVG